TFVQAAITQSLGFAGTHVNQRDDEFGFLVRARFQLYAYFSRETVRPRSVGEALFKCSSSERLDRDPRVDADRQWFFNQFRLSPLPIFDPHPSSHPNDCYEIPRSLITAPQADTHRAGFE